MLFINMLLMGVFKHSFAVIGFTFKVKSWNMIVIIMTKTDQFINDDAYDISV